MKLLGRLELVAPAAARAAAAGAMTWRGRSPDRRLNGI
jgi:hypothetical protein